MGDLVFVVEPTEYDIGLIPTDPAGLLEYCERQIEKGVDEAISGRNRVAINTDRIALHALYLQIVDPAGNHIFPDMESYLQGRGKQLMIARSTHYKHHKTQGIIRFADVPIEEVLLLGDGIPTAHHAKHLAASSKDINRKTGEITKLNPVAEAVLERIVPGGTVQEKVHAAFEHLFEARKQLVSPDDPNPRLPSDEVIKWFKNDLGGRRIIKPLCREFPDGRKDFGWFIEDTGEVGWFSEDIPPADVWEWYLSKTGAVERG